MYINKEDYMYFEGLSKGLDEGKRKRFLEILLKAAGKKAGTDISKIEVVGDEIYDVRGIGEGQMLTRTIIKKAYKAAKEE